MAIEDGNESNNNLGSKLESVDGSGHDKDSRTHERSGSSENSLAHVEVLDEDKPQNHSVNGSASSDIVISHSTSSSSSSSSSASSLKNESQVAENGSQGPPDMPPTQSPPVQVMDRSVGYDPNRIPSSIFNRSKSGTPMEWSVASNESLFSIHVGNSSFSMDPGFSCSELFKSEELTGHTLSPPPPPPSPSRPPPLPPPSPPAMKSNKTDGANITAEAEEPKKALENKGDVKPGVSWKSVSTSTCSDLSGNSKASFSFPILAEEVTSEPVKPEASTADQNPAQEPTETTPNSTYKNWFSCLPSCSWCCTSRSCSCSCS